MVVRYGGGVPSVVGGLVAGLFCALQGVSDRRLQDDVIFNMGKCWLNLAVCMSCGGLGETFLWLFAVFWCGMESRPKSAGRGSLGGIPWFVPLTF